MQNESRFRMPVQRDEDLALDERLAAAVDEVDGGEQELLLEVEKAGVVAAATRSCSSAENDSS